METANMDSLSSFYDLFEGVPVTKTHPEAAPGLRAPEALGPQISEDGLPGLADLDPSVELSLDLQELIDRASKTSEDQHPLTDDPLNQDILFPEIAACSEIEAIVNREDELHTAGPSVQDPMPEVVEEQLPADDACESSVLTVQAADLVALGFDPSNTANVSYIKIEPVPATACSINAAEAELPELITGEAVSSSTEHECTKPVGRNPLKATSSKARASSGRRKQPDIGTPEYVAKRERNNVAVRKSRDKAKQRQQLTESRVKELAAQNQQLLKKVDLLMKELNVLKGLFTNVGAALPEGLAELLK